MGVVPVLTLLAVHLLLVLLFLGSWVPCTLFPLLLLLLVLFSSCCSSPASSCCCSFSRAFTSNASPHLLILLPQCFHMLSCSNLRIVTDFTCLLPLSLASILPTITAGGSQCAKLAQRLKLDGARFALRRAVLCSAVSVVGERRQV